MVFSKRLILICGLLVLISPALFAQMPERVSGAVAEFERHIQDQLDQKEIVGLSIAFSYGDLEWAKGFGYADLENKVPASVESSYRMASVSKPMTAVGILELVEQGKINLDAEVQTYVPDFPRKRWPLTVRHLLGHLGGVSHYRNYDNEANTTKQMTTEEALAIFEDWELLHEPGTRYQYTTYGYNLLGAIIEGAAGLPLDQYLTEVVWRPLGMENTSVDYLFKLVPNRVRGYRRVNGTIENTRPVNTSLKIGGGGTRSTAPDMVRFAQGLSDGKLLESATLEQMWTSMSTADQRNIGYGMGWSTYSLNGRYAVAHGGAQEGTRTYLLHLPGEDLTVFGASNFENTSPSQYVRRLAMALLGESGAMPEVYISDRSEGPLFEALQRAHRQGLAYFNWRNEAAETDPVKLRAAFQYLNQFASMQPGKQTSEHLEDGEHPLTGQPFRAVGSYMAS